MPQPEYDGGSAIQPDQFAALQKGIAYRDLIKTEGYRLLLDYLEFRSNQALADMRITVSMPDASKVTAMAIWTEREEMLKAMQIEVQDGIARAQELAKEFQDSRIDLTGIPFSFGDDD